MAKRIFDRFGFDKDGYNKEGFDRMGYNRQGYDRQGFNKQGLNIKGINKLTGYDKDGFDSEGFNKEGYDRDGYDQNGFNEAGYNREGFNQAGYDKDGYDRYGFNGDGFNREGYNQDGYDKNGYDRLGYDQFGYDNEGYNREGYDRNGYNRQGVDLEGYDKEGYDQFGFDREGFYRNGYDLNGLNKEGRNILGYDTNGFDVNGMSLDGYSRELFDEDGFNIYTGYNLKGYNRDGYNSAGYDAEGYDKLGYHSLTGLDRSGFDVDGYGRSGYNKNGYDRNGYNRDGYDAEGYDKNGFDVDGYNREGYDRDGYNCAGYDVNGYDVNGALSPELRQKKRNTKMDSKQDVLEAEYFKKCAHQINNYYRNQVRKEVVKDYAPITRHYIDQWGFIQSETKKPDSRVVEQKIESRVKSVLREPYFAHVDYRDDAELYLGKQAVHGWVTDWADERASLYYQYQMYIGNKKTDLHYVRDIYFAHSKYNGYEDKYNASIGSEELGEATDKYLAQIIRANQNNKKIHDIVESIQQNQYDIITADKNQSALVLGCAGSGKTMILMHKIRYMKYNNSDLKMSDIIVISPTDVLGSESKELSKLLQIENIQQFMTSSFYEHISKELFLKLDLTYEEFHVVDEDTPIIQYYSKTALEELTFSINSDLRSTAYIKQQQQQVQEMLNAHIEITKRSKKTISEMHKLYVDSVKEIRKAGVKDIERILRQIDREVNNRELIEDTIEIIRILNDQNCFSGKRDKDTSEVNHQFTYTKKMISAMEQLEFIRVANKLEIRTEIPLQMVQVIQLFMNDKMIWEDIQKLFCEWASITIADANAYIAYLEKELVLYDCLERKRDILQYLLDNGMVMNRSLENSSFTYTNSFEKLLKLYDELGEDLEKIGYTPFSYFEEYEKIDRRRKRIREQSVNNTRKNYLYDAILNKLGITYDKTAEIIIPKSKAFAMTYILQKYAANLSEKKKYIYIDEFQDFSSLELELIKDIFPLSTISLFGDIKQCINEKGIKSKNDIPANLYEKEYRINENYRNAHQITNYVKTELGIEMLPVGLDGKMEILDDIPDIFIEADDRVALIVKDAKLFKESYSFERKVNFYTDSREIVRGILNVIPVSMTKGLEFEKVILIQDGMSRNEYYVGCTRAISDLYVVKVRGDNDWTEKTLANAFQPEKYQVEENTSGDTVEEKNKQKSATLKARTLSGEMDFSQYCLTSFQGKLKNVTGTKHTPSTYIIIEQHSKEKSIQVYYSNDTKLAYVSDVIYTQYYDALAPFFAPENIGFVNTTKTSEHSKTGVIDDDIKGTVTIVPISEKCEVITESNRFEKMKEEIIPKKENRVLETYVFDNTKTIELMDRFEGIGTGEPYKQLIIKRALNIFIGNEYVCVDLVVERSRLHNYEGNITFTQFKKGEVYELKEFVRNILIGVNINQFKKSGKMIEFDHPYLLRAQNSRNRTGYGWEWDWTDRYGPLVTEGTLYGETTNYVFVGAYIR